MKCPNCQTVNSDTVKTCINCGEPFREKVTLQVAGGLNLLAGFIDIFYAIWYFSQLLGGDFDLPYPYRWYINAAAFIVGIMIFVSGFFLLDNKRWRLGFIGSILAIHIPVLGVTSAILCTSEREDWSKTRRRLIGGIFILFGVVTTIPLWLLWAVLLGSEIM